MYKQCCGNIFIAKEARACMCKIVCLGAVTKSGNDLILCWTFSKLTFLGFARESKWEFYETACKNVTSAGV